MKVVRLKNKLVRTVEAEIMRHNKTRTEIKSVAGYKRVSEFDERGSTE